MRLSFRVFSLALLFADTAEGFSPVAGRFRPFKDTSLSLYPTDTDFRTPAASFTFTRCATRVVTSDFVQSEWGGENNNNSQRLSYLDVISSTVPVPANPGLDTEDDDTDPEPLAQAHRIQQAYREWCEFYGKTANKERLGIFASNFLQVKEFHERTGRPLVLNALADMTEEEYRAGKHLSTSTADAASEPFESEDRIRGAYKEWCEYYGRSEDEKRFQTFASNFIAVEKYHLQTNQSLVLNEFADMTDREYQRHMTTAAHFTTPETSAVVDADNHTALPTANDDPITSYLDPEPTPSSVSEIQPSNVPSSGTHVIQSGSSSNEDDVYDTSGPSDDYIPSSSVTHDVISALQNRIATLAEMVQDLTSAASATQPVQEAQAQPLDSLVIDVLQKQDESIMQLEESVEDLHIIQMQSSDLIELVSSNQRQMTDMMTSVQTEVTALQEHQAHTDENYAKLLERIEELEAAVAKYDQHDPVLDKTLVLTPATAPMIPKRMVEVRPNIPPIAGNPMFRPINLDPQ